MKKLHEDFIDNTDKEELIKTNEMDDIMTKLHQLPYGDILVKVAQIAAKHSKARNSSNVPVDYCEVKYVKKPSGSKPGMVIYSNNKTFNVNP